MKGTQTQHTPGPWTFGENVGKRPSWEYICASEDGSSICTMAQVPNGKANARLIASAPDLLAAATAAFQWLDYVRRWPGGQDILIETQPGGFGLDKLQAAIRAAEGGR